MSSGCSEQCVLESSRQLGVFVLRQIYVLKLLSPLRTYLLHAEGGKALSFTGTGSRMTSKSDTKAFHSPI